METAFFNGHYLPKNEIRISPEDRGFLFAEGIYEVVRWYEGFFYDMNSHMTRLKRSLREIKIRWHDEDSFPEIARQLITLNSLNDRQALVYLQVTRGGEIRTHSYPNPPVEPTVYAFARDFIPENSGKEGGVGVMLKDDIRWSRCDIKSVALLPNTLCYQEALDNGFFECAFIRNGYITECSHSNIFFVIHGVLYTHPECGYVLSGVTRKNVLRIANQAGMAVKVEPVSERMLEKVQEAFITNTSGELTPVIALNNLLVGNGQPGPVTRILRERFNEELCSLRHS
jgi:D-alanine transaminase